MAFIDRKITDQLQEAVRHFPALVLTGARQTGKTTLLRKLYPHFQYVSLDRPLVAEQAERDPESFLRANPPPLIVDEVQYAPSLFRFLKIQIDEKRESKGQFILTGSQKFTLMKGVTESLAGRVAVMELEGLSVLELPGKNLERDYPSLMTRGGFPELWVEPAPPPPLFFDSYIATYLERDVKQILAVGDLRDFERFLRACALRTAQQLNKSDLAREVGVSVPTIGSWLSVLEALGQIVLLEPWFGNVSKRLVKAPKLYMSETSLACRLCGVDASNLETSPLVGPLWETFVFAELRKQLAFKGHRPKLWYYRDQAQWELDFIWEQGHLLSFFECKWTSSPRQSDAKNMDRIQTLFENKGKIPYAIKEKVLVSRAREHFSADGLSFRSPISGLFDD
ncbi:MAG: ATP-binding protein [Deltaproteobacteria bacterium]|nr:ATP-binding protein [Deltaproteobacteria bacterium]